MVRPRIEAGGAGRTIINLVSGLLARGIQVVVAAGGGEWLSELEKLTTCYRVPL
jgi:hypothetical protein